MDPDDWVNKMEMDTADGLAHNLLDFNKEPDYSNIQDEILPPGVCLIRQSSFRMDFIACFFIDHS